MAYVPELHGSAIAFEKRPEFTDFRQEYISQLNVLKKFLEKHLGAAQASARNEEFTRLQDRLFNKKNHYYEGKKEILFGAGKRALDQLLLQLDDETLPLTCRLDVVEELAVNIAFCPEGAATQLALSSNTLRLMQGGSDAHRLKEAMARQLVIEYLRQSGIDDAEGGMHTHFVTKLQNGVAAALGLPTQEDRHAAGSGLTEQHIDECLQYILQRMTPTRMALVLADECLSEFANTMQSNFSDAHTDDTSGSFDAGFFYAHLQDAMVPLKERCGDADIACFISPLEDGDAIRYRLNRDPALLALKILQSGSLFKPDMLTDAFRPATLLKHSAGAAEIEVRHYGSQLIWASENGNETLLQARHLAGSRPDEFGATAGAALASALLNSSEQDLLRHFPAAWLAEADMTQLLAKVKTLSTAFFEKHTQTVLQLNLKKRRELANAIVAGGAPSDLAACKFDAAQLLSVTDAFGNAVFFKAMLRADAAMLGALGDMLLQAPVSVRASVLAGAVLEGGIYGVPLLHRALCNPIDPAAIAALGGILMQAMEKGYFLSDQLAHFLAARDTGGVPGLALGLELGLHRQIDAFGELLFSAHKKGYLNSSDLFSLLKCRSNDDHSPALASAIENGHGATVAALGRIIEKAYSSRILNASQVNDILACDPLNGFVLPLAIKEANIATRNAFSDLLLELDRIGRDINGPESAYLSLAIPEEKSELPDNLRQARSLKTLLLLEQDVKRLSRAGLQQDIRDGRLGLFLYPGAMRIEKEKIFSRIMHAWGPRDRNP
ncbi:hypothetical protein D9O50_09950 [Oxalobacteraceae bacterium CAVE-383]|nr:hypothetical protein D9O50_09950 [Oxalobacteraceae bacterium CAVE-383]